MGVTRVARSPGWTAPAWRWPAPSGPDGHVLQVSNGKGVTFGRRPPGRALRGGRALGRRAAPRRARGSSAELRERFGGAASSSRPRWRPARRRRLGAAPAGLARRRRPPRRRAPARAGPRRPLPAGRHRAARPGGGRLDVQRHGRAPRRATPRCSTRCSRPASGTSWRGRCRAASRRPRCGARLLAPALAGAARRRARRRWRRDARGARLRRCTSSTPAARTSASPPPRRCWSTTSAARCR